MLPAVHSSNFFKLHLHTKWGGGYKNVEESLRFAPVPSSRNANRSSLQNVFRSEKDSVLDS